MRDAGARVMTNEPMVKAHVAKRVSTQRNAIIQFVERNPGSTSSQVGKAVGRTATGNVANVAIGGFLRRERSGPQNLWHYYPVNHISKVLVPKREAMSEVEEAFAVIREVRSVVERSIWQTKQQLLEMLMLVLDNTDIGAIGGKRSPSAQGGTK